MNGFILSTRIWVRGTIVALRHPRLLFAARGD